MSRSALASRSAVLVMHAVFQVPSVVAVPSSRPVIASKRDGSCIPGLQSIRNNVREGTWNTACIMSTAEHEARTLRDIGHKLSLSCHLKD